MAEKGKKLGQYFIILENSELSMSNLRKNFGLRIFLADKKDKLTNRLTKKVDFLI